MRLSKALLKKYADDSYTEVGHGREHVFLWVYDKNLKELFTHELEEGHDSWDVHGDYFDEGDIEFSLAGRYVPEDKVITVSAHEGKEVFTSEMQFRAVLKHVVQLLKDTFGEDIRFRFFNDTRNMIEAMKKEADGSYLDIGHGRERVALWVYDVETGELLTHELTKEKTPYMVHNKDIFPIKNIEIAGRYSFDSNKISFHVMSGVVNKFGETRTRAVIRHVVDLLKQKFGSDIDFHFFGSARNLVEAMKKEADGNLHYMDVGHSGGPAMLWGYRFDEDRLYYEKVTDSGRGDNTHSDLFKDLSGGVNTRNSDKFDAWGRIDLRTNRGSVAFPQQKSSYIEYRAKAKILKEKLQSKFGDVDFVYYWPDDVMELMATKKEAYGGNKNSYLIALYPKNVTEIEKFKQSLQLEDAEEILNPDQFHITLRYWPDHENLEDKIATFLHKSVNAKEHISLTPKGLDLLGDDGCLVIEFEPDSIITDLFKFIDDGIQELGAPPSDYSTFRPHMTLAVGVKNIPDKQPKFKIIIDRIALVQNDKVLWESKI